VYSGITAQLTAKNISPQSKVGVGISLKKKKKKIENNK